MIARELTCEDARRQRPEHAHGPAELAVGGEVHPRPGAVGLEGPRPVDRLRALHDVHVDAPRAVELGELDDLFELAATGRLRALAHARAEPGRTVGELLHRRLRGLPLGEVRRVGEVVEYDLRGTGDGECLLDVHGPGPQATAFTPWRLATRATMSRMIRVRSKSFGV